MRVVNYIVTLGGSEELKDAKAKYDLLYQDYIKDYGILENKQKKIEEKLSELGVSLVSAQKSLLVAEKLLKSSRNTLDFNDINNDKLQTQITHFKSSSGSALGAGFGGVVGGTTALGAWAVVSVIGSASTGTAIASLSGVAATNATLAWFGGGALAAGGAGMSGGMMVLGGIVAAPVIYFAAKGAYAKAEKINREHEKLLEGHAQVMLALEEMKTKASKTIELCNSIIAMNDDFCFQISRHYSIIRPFGLLSKISQSLRRLIGLNALSPIQADSLNKINRVTESFVEQFSTSQPKS
ncbi:conserved membrane hypothetical protein [Vibrio chagasii]|nr:conserved membrane hypothetical protein [Vibrio chagasii]CAH7353035.1 conserved membrane hypothetical protein [Vibrio chagasii]CAH7385182.1 conserved membrane hypothetical protein [Vibrio chagasii]